MLGKHLVLSAIAVAAALLTAPMQAQFLYVTNFDYNISGLTINPTTGALTEISPSPLAGLSANTIAVDPTGKFIYAPDSEFPVGVHGYTINATTGLLTAISGQPFAGVSNLTDVAVDPTGKFVYVTAAYGYSGLGDLTGSVSAYTINPTTGALTEISGSPWPAQIGAGFVTVDPSGKFVYVANYFGSGVYPYIFGSVSVYSINPTTGALTEINGSPFASSSGYTARLAIDPTGRFAYVTSANNDGQPGVTVYAIDSNSGALTETNFTPWVAGTEPETVVIDPTGKYAYVVNYGQYTPSPGSVYAYAINATTGALTEINGSPFAAGTNPVAGVIDPTGKFIYVANVNSHNISAYAINAATGALTEISGSPFAFPQLFAFPEDLAVRHVRFAGTSGGMQCNGQSVSTLAAQYGSLAAAANALGYTNVQALMNAIRAYCQ
jgi:6-phosphogluconolactonase (cycloisomerase 2 family)